MQAAAQEEQCAHLHDNIRIQRSHHCQKKWHMYPALQIMWKGIYIPLGITF